MKRHILIMILAALSLWSRESSAFWGSDSSDSTSGLNVTAGYDVNTIATVTGTVMTLPARTGQEQLTVMSVAAVQGSVTVVLGPWWYWKTQTMSLSKNQELAVTGSLAQGKDGALYIFAQRIENRSNGETVTLRSEAGTPFWSGAGSGSRHGTRQYNGGGPQFGAGSRGNGMRGGRR
ncbi:MAG: hypothetical protein M0T70_14525 [Geobacteraceae bacterium]|nr:hypothetical protein [Geobacteraceae bacterium]